MSQVNAASKQAWHSLGSLLARSPDQLEEGDIDEKGEHQYGKPATVPAYAVYELQEVVAALAPGSAIGEPDGAFGGNTAATLKLVTGHPVFQRGRDLPVLIAAVVEIISSELEKPRAQGEEVATAKDDFQHPSKYVRGDMPHWCQGDPRWADRVMGAKRRFRKAGCAACSVAMVLSWVAQRAKGSLLKEITPEELDDWMDHNGGWYVKPDGTKTDLIMWGNFSKCATQFFGSELGYHQSGDRDHSIPEEALIKHARMWVDQMDMPIILRVQYKGDSYGQWFNHFVVCIGYDDDGVLRFLDPGYGIGGDLTHPNNRLDQTANKGGYRLVACEEFEVKEKVA